ncbi:carboxypeptidase-like regulatory domain-containing protein [Pontibacter mangrovi]|uniref:Carboxypeptidase-like regulatory domain-containing protein n=1 Tax=Pontibacter mangrovi TaxID=2589816 RepID=A0A501W5V1_9BACT|nr:carboxypeptidase-like regulatory domain-containing protein [Pontibacter mangrovi]TPE44122.1 carboxypeptidase-like regulatory domain-containing protein [Pontibacter mangrovi]
MLPYLQTCCCTFALVLLCALPMRAQQRQLSGTVVAAGTGAPIAGAGVIILKTNSIAITDKFGRFSLYAQAQDSLLVRAVGYKPLRYQVKDVADAPQQIVLRLQEEAVQLREVQVESLPSQVKRPNYRPPVQLPPPAPAPPPSIIWNPVSYFSREGKQRRKLRKFLKKEQEKRNQQEAERLRQELERKKQDYNRFFKDNTGYE